MQARPITWVILYPDGETRAVISMEGQSTTVAGREFGRLLAIIDQTEELARLV